MLKTDVKNTGDIYGVGSYNNTISQELQNAVLLTGQTLNGGDQQQLSQAVARVGSAIYSYLDSGIANAYVLQPLQSNYKLTAYVEGMTVAFIPQNGNTGPSTANVSNLGAVQILNPDRSPLVAFQISTTIFVELVYIDGAFILLEEFTQSTALESQIADQTPGSEGSRLIGNTNIELFGGIPRAFGSIRVAGGVFVLHTGSYNIASVSTTAPYTCNITFTVPMMAGSYLPKCQTTWDGVSSAIPLAACPTTTPLGVLSVLSGNASSLPQSFDFTVYEVR